MMSYCRFVLTIVAKPPRMTKRGNVLILFLFSFLLLLDVLVDRIVDIKPVYLLCTAFLFPTSHRDLFTITKCDDGAICFSFSYARYFPRNFQKFPYLFE